LIKGWRRKPRLLACVLGPLFVAGALGLWVLNASRVGPLESCLSNCAAAGEAGRDTLRVMDLNVLHGFPRFEALSQRLDLIAQEIQRQNADLVCLQEVPWTLRLGSAARRLAGQVGMNYVYLPANGNRKAILFSEGEAILSRFPLQDVNYIELQPRAGFFEQRVALKATAITPWGAVNVISTHLTTGGGEINRAQAQALQQFVASQSPHITLIAGDFNAREDSAQILDLSQGWVDSYRLANPFSPGPTCCAEDLGSSGGEFLQERIDYIFIQPGVAPNFQVVSSRVILNQPFHSGAGWQWASDHAGLLTELRLLP
jgi:endonuclease/exonuclease/phosphatase family metal-dependent hydrolase